MKSYYHLFWYLLMYSCARLSLLFLGFLHVSLYQQGDWSLLGHVEVSEPTPVWNTLSICPTGLTDNKTTEEKLLSVVGNDNGLSFTVQIAEGASEIALDEPHTVNVHGDEVSVFQFIPPQGISDKQLDITATSESKVAAYLKVSQNCKEVDLQEDLESIDYKKESLRLSFARKGRITLSRVSIPPLTDSVSGWFIGIGLKNLSGDVKLSESKNVTLKLTRSFDYNYATPICVLVFVSFLVGILVSIFAYFLFEESLTKVKVGKGKPGDDNVELKISCCDLWEVIIDHWFSFGPKTYSYVTGIVGAVLMVGAFQFVFANWDTMIQEGDRDNCYYNDFCYRVANHDIPFNLMISNLTYIVHGLILVVWVLILEAKVNLRCGSRAKSAIPNDQRPTLHEHYLSCPETNIHHHFGVAIPEPENPMKMDERKTKERNFFAEGIKKMYCFSIGYAFSWGLVFEGLFSTLYHFCPSRFTFQFDSAFMFIIAGLTVLLLYNGIEQNRCSSSENVKHPVGASNFFLFFIVPLFIFNYFGVLFNSDSLNKVMQGFFFAFLIIWWLVMFFWAFRNLDICRDNCSHKCNAGLFLFGGLLVPWGIFMCYLFSDLAQVFLFACIACSVVAILAKARPWKKCACESARPKTKDILQGIFILFTLIILVAALVVFKALPTTNKTSSPENSRDQNKECAILGFFDWHDLWHFLSSFALLMGAFVIMFISSKAEEANTHGNRVVPVG